MLVVHESIFCEQWNPSAFIVNVKRNLMDVTLAQVSGGAYNRKRGLHLLRKSFPVSVLWGSIAQLTEVITLEGHL